jgi:hypothetical protein
LPRRNIPCNHRFSLQQQEIEPMSIFTKIKDAIFGKKAEARETATPPIGGGLGTSPRTDSPTLEPVDVENRLDSMPGADKLNWRTSIVDLMKLIGVDADNDSRMELAQEMGRTDYSGSAEDNVWLHRRVMQDLAKTGGRVPAEYLD